MTGTLIETLVAVAFAHTAEVHAWRVTMSREEGEHIERTLRNLLDLGHVAAFSVRHSNAGAVSNLVEQLRSRVGGMVLDACIEATEAPRTPLPAFLMPVWSFDHAIGGLPAATGHLLGLDIELIASPSSDEEVGALLPGRVGLWLIHAQPLGT